MAIEMMYRTLGRRFWASALDFLVLFPLIGLEGTLLESKLSASAKASLYGACVVCTLAYSVVMHWRFGATLGKQATGVRVFNLAGGALLLRQALARDAITIVLVVCSTIPDLVTIGASRSPEFESDVIASWASTIILVLEILTALTNDKRRSIHDFIAGTVVERDPVPVRTT